MSFNSNNVRFIRNVTIINNIPLLPTNTLCHEGTPFPSTLLFFQNTSKQPLTTFQLNDSNGNQYVVPDFFVWEPGQFISINFSGQPILPNGNFSLYAGYTSDDEEIYYDFIIFNCINQNGSIYFEYLFNTKQDYIAVFSSISSSPAVTLVPEDNYNFTYQIPSKEVGTYCNLSGNFSGVDTETCFDTSNCILSGIDASAFPTSFCLLNNTNSYVTKNNYIQLDYDPDDDPDDDPNSDYDQDNYTIEIVYGYVTDHLDNVYLQIGYLPDSSGSLTDSSNNTQQSYNLPGAKNTQTTPISFKPGDAIELKDITILPGNYIQIYLRDDYDQGYYITIHNRNNVMVMTYNGDSFGIDPSTFLIMGPNTVTKPNVENYTSSLFTVDAPSSTKVPTGMITVAPTTTECGIYPKSTINTNTCSIGGPAFISSCVTAKLFRDSTGYGAEINVLNPYHYLGKWGAIASISLSGSSASGVTTIVNEKSYSLSCILKTISSKSVPNTLPNSTAPDAFGSTSYKLYFPNLGPIGLNSEFMSGYKATTNTYEPYRLSIPITITSSKIGTIQIQPTIFSLTPVLRVTKDYFITEINPIYDSTTGIITGRIDITNNKSVVTTAQTATPSSITVTYGVPNNLSSTYLITKGINLSYTVSKLQSNVTNCDVTFSYSMNQPEISNSVPISIIVTPPTSCPITIITVTQITSTTATISFNGSFSDSKNNNIITSYRMVATETGTTKIVPITNNQTLDWTKTSTIKSITIYPIAYNVAGKLLGPPYVFTICPAGYYCPTTSSKIICPNGTYSTGNATSSLQCTSGNVLALTQSQIAGITDSTVLSAILPTLTATQITYLTVGVQIPTLTSAQIKTIAVTSIPKLTVQQLGAIKPIQFSYFTKNQIQALTPIQCNSLLLNQLQNCYINMTYGQLFNLSLEIKNKLFLVPEGVICPAGKYCPVVNSYGSVISCPAGNYCGVNVVSPTPCPAGNYCPVGTSSVTPCPAGSYCPNSRTKIDCPAGYYCPASSTSGTANSCLAGSYCPSGSTTQTPCPAGSFCTDPTQSNLCQRGSYCPSGSTTQTPCPAGSFCPTPTQSNVCQTGSYCPSGSTTQTPCPAGSFCPTPTQSSLCLATGSYCPSGSTTQNPCPAGSFCPTPTQSISCQIGSYCPSGSTTRVPCPAGSFCPDPTQSNSCQTGSYCPPGSTTQTPCPAGTFCNTLNLSSPFDVLASMNMGMSQPSAMTSGSTWTITNITNTSGHTPRPTQQGNFGFIIISGSGTAKIETNTISSTSLTTTPWGQGYLIDSILPGQSCTIQWNISPNSSLFFYNLGLYNNTFSVNYIFTINQYGLFSSELTNPVSYISDVFTITGVSYIKSCSIGTYCPAGSSIGNPCRSGYYCPDPTREIQCTSGNFCPSGSTSQSSCPYNSYSSNGSSVCSPCPSGSYSDTNSATCTTCPAGSYCPILPFTIAYPTSTSSNFTIINPYDYTDITYSYPTGFTNLQKGAFTISTTVPTGSYPITINYTINGVPHSYTSTIEIKVYDRDTPGQHTVSNLPSIFYTVVAGAAGGDYNGTGGTGGTISATLTNLSSMIVLIATTSGGGASYYGGGNGGYYTALLTSDGQDTPLVVGGGGGGGSSGGNYSGGSSQLNFGTNGIVGMGATVDTGGNGGYYTDGTGGTGGNKTKGTDGSSGTGGGSGKDGIGGTGKINLGTFQLNGGGGGAGLYGGGGGGGDNYGAGGGGALGAGGGGAWYSSGGAGSSYIVPNPSYVKDSRFTPTTSKEGSVMIISIMDKNKIECPVGTYNSLTGQTDSSSCLICSTGSYCPNSSTITSCPSGTYNLLTGQTDSSSCLICRSGFCPAGSTSQLTCPAGSYCPNSSTITRCPSGTYNLLTGQTDSSSCLICPEGYYCPSVTSNPISCPLGTYNTLTNQTDSSSCLICPAGSYCPNSSTITSCPTGTYNTLTNQTDSSSCLICHAGSYCPNSSTITSCPTGTYNSITNQTDSSSCITCPTGSYCPNSSTITSCPTGTYNSLTNQTVSSSCLICHAGSYCPNSSTITSCLKGTYNSLTNQTDSSSCITCPTGSYCPNSSTITTCPTGTYNSLTSQTNISSCLTCPTGSYCPNSSTITSCPKGTYNSLTGQTDSSSCLICPTGSYCPSITLNPISCPKGTYNSLTGQTDSLSCLICPTGSYCPNSSTITSCPTGTYNSLTNQTNSSSCITCLAGSYCPNSSTITSCPTGKTSSIGSTSISQCLPLPPTDLLYTPIERNINVKLYGKTIFITNSGPDILNFNLLLSCAIHSTSCKVLPNGWSLDTSYGGYLPLGVSNRTFVSGSTVSFKMPFSERDLCSSQIQQLNSLYLYSNNQLSDSVQLNNCDFFTGGNCETFRFTTFTSNKWFNEFILSYN